MKTKKFDKKLVLSKKTVSNLSVREMVRANGGDRPPFSWTCNFGTICTSMPCC